MLYFSTYQYFPIWQDQYDSKTEGGGKTEDEDLEEPDVVTGHNNHRQQWIVEMPAPPAGTASVGMEGQQADRDSDSDTDRY